MQMSSSKQQAEEQTHRICFIYLLNIFSIIPQPKQLLAITQVKKYIEQKKKIGQKEEYRSWQNVT